MKKFVFCCCILILILLGSKVVYAAKSSHVLSYNVYAGGVYAVTAKLSLDISKSSYHAELDAGTRGFLKTLAPWEGSFISKGLYQKETYRPKLHKTTSGWKEETDIKEYRYDQNGRFLGLKHIEDGADKSPKSIDPQLTNKTTDVLSATLNVMAAVAKGGACAGSSDVFDGKRRFKMIFRDKGTVTLKKSNNAIYEGPAQECTIEIKPDGGAWNKKPRGWLSIQEQGRKAGTMPTIWMAKLPSVSVAVPVRIRVKTSYGTLFMHLSDIQ